MKASQSSLRRARNRKNPASRIEVQNRKRLRGDADSGDAESKSLKIDALLLDHEWALHYLCKNGTDVFSNYAEKQQLDRSQEEQPNNQRC
jgi:hypothetical protein